MTTNTNDIRLVIHLEGGIVQAVYSNSATVIKVAIQDLDIDGADGDEMAELDDGTEFVGHIEPILRDDTHVARVFAAFGEENIVVDKQQENYVAKKGLICPNCGSNDVEAKSSFDGEGLAGLICVECNHCKSTWIDRYCLVGFDSLEIGSKV